MVTVVIELESFNEWWSREPEFDEKTFKLNKWSSRFRITFFGYDSEKDIIYNSNLNPESNINSVPGEVKTKLDKDGKYIVPVEYDIGPFGKMVKKELIQNNKIMRLNKKKYDIETNEEFKERIKKLLLKFDFLEGKIHGSAEEIYVEHE